MNASSHWTWRWVAGLVAAGVMVFLLNQAFGIPARVAVLENEKQNLWRKLDEMDRKLDELKADLKDVKKEVKQP